MIFMMQNKNKFFSSIGLILNEFKKSFLLVFVFLIIAFGITYLFSIISFTFYLIVASKTTATIFLIVTCLFVLIALVIFYSIFNYIKKIALVKVINLNLKYKDKKMLVFIDSLLDNEHKNKNKLVFKRLGIFLTTILFILLVLFLLVGLWNIISSLWLKIIVFTILGLIIIPFFMFITRYCFFVNSLRELLFSYRIFVEHYILMLTTIIISIIPLTIFWLVYYLLPQYVVLDYIFLFLFILSIEFAIYYHFFIVSFIYLDQCEFESTDSKHT
jgi:hypothetical protein